MASPTTSPTLKRSADPEFAEPEPKKHAIEAFDLYPLFATIQNAVCFEEGELSTTEIANMLPQMDTGVLSPFNQVLIGKIQEQFKLFLAEAKADNQSGKKIFGVLNELYQISLLNSSTKESLAQAAQDLNGLKARLHPTIREQMLSVVVEGNAALVRTDSDTTPDQIAKKLQQIDTCLQKLVPFIGLQRYLDPVDNKRILDLALVLRQQDLGHHYQAVISDYPGLVNRISMLTAELQQVFHIAKVLTQAKLQLQKELFSHTAHARTVPTVQTRFLNAFGSAFYEAFAWHFWNIAWNSSHEKKVTSMLKQIPGWSKADPHKVDYSLLNAIWVKFLPQHSIEDWMLRALESCDSHHLDVLESKLQKLSKDSAEVRESRDLDKDAQKQMLEGFKKEMFDLCLHATEPEFSSLAELKNYLL